MYLLIIAIVVFLIIPFAYVTIVFYRKLYRRLHFQNQSKRPIEDYAAQDITPQRVSFKTEDGIPAVGLFYSAGSGQHPVVIMLHGFAHHMGDHSDRFKRLLSDGYHVFSFDFRGFGESTHDSTTIGLKEYLDVIGAVDYLKTRDDVDCDRMVLWGGSMGAVSGIRALPYLKSGIRAMIADSAFYDVYSMVGIRFKKRGLPTFPSFYFVLLLSVITGEWMHNNSAAKALKKIDSVPILFCHGTKDIDTDFDDSVRMYKMYRGPKEFLKLEGESHENHDEIPGYLDTSINFIKKHI